MLSNPMLKTALLGAAGGALAAARVDYAAFKSWKDVHEAMQYNWWTAVWRWFQGAVGGAIGALGAGALIGG